MTEKINTSPSASNEQHDPFEVIADIQARQAAQRLIEEQGQPAESHSATEKAGFTKPQKLVVGGLIVGAALLVGPEVVDRIDGPEFSPESTTYVVQPGDGLQHAAEAVIGSEDVDIRDVIEHISVDPANIGALKDGLQPAESITIPLSVQK